MISERLDGYRFSRSRFSHPDDALKRLARGGRSPIGPEIYDGYRPKPADPRRWWLLGFALTFAFFVGLLLMPLFVNRNKIEVIGLTNGASITKERLQSNSIAFRVTPANQLKKITLRIDGTPLRVIEQAGSLTWLPPRLQDGPHRLTVRSGSRMLWRGPAATTIRFTVDSQAPKVVLGGQANLAPLNKPFVLSGTVSEPATITVAGEVVKVENGKFQHTFSYPPIGKIIVTAADPAGNRTEIGEFARVAYQTIRGVHMSAVSWITPTLKDDVMKLADQKKINTIQLDLKDESGVVGYRSSLAQVADLNSSANLFDLREAVDELHGRGLRVVGRLVVFRDPIFTADAIKRGNRDDIIQAPDGSPYKSRYGAFANPLSSRVHDYNLAIAREAAEAGVDDILFDYIRRPEGQLSNMVLPGLVGDAGDAVDDALASFLRKTSNILKGTPTRVGISVFGISAKTPEQIGQNVKRMSQLVDYVAPMVYPSHWSSGQYNVTNPNSQPGTIVGRSLLSFKDAIADSGAVLVPWLQDFSLNGYTYGPKELRAQIDAANDEGIAGFLIWDPKVTYSEAGFPSDAPPNVFEKRLPTATPANGKTTSASGSKSPSITAATVPPTKARSSKQTAASSKQTAASGS
jgi:hypothetical protein